MNILKSKLGFADVRDVNQVMVKIVKFGWQIF